MKHYVFLANGFEDLEALSVIDIMRRAGLDVVTVSINDTNVVTSAHNMPMVADILLAEVDFTTEGYLILPGGMPGTTNLWECTTLCEQVKAHAEAGLPVAAICAAPLIFGRLGILEGKNATCYPGFEGELKGANCTAEGVVKAGNVITGKGPGKSPEFAFAIVASLLGEAKANEISSAMQY
jgi:4-methyl-5(b-hydroxyethyl)-thiazole monophosphate biosynthesis